MSWQYWMQGRAEIPSHILWRRSPVCIRDRTLQEASRDRAVHHTCEVWEPDRAGGECSAEEYCQAWWWLELFKANWCGYSEVSHVTTNLTTGRIKKNARILLPNKNGHNSVNFKAIWLKFYSKVDDTFMKLRYFISHPKKMLIKNRKFWMKFLSLCLFSI